MSEKHIDLRDRHMSEKINSIKGEAQRAADKAVNRLRSDLARRRKVELRWWWFSFDLRNHRSTIYDAMTAVVALAIALCIAAVLFYVGCKGMGVPL